MPNSAFSEALHLVQEALIGWPIHQERPLTSSAMFRREALRAQLRPDRQRTLGDGASSLDSSHSVSEPACPRCGLSARKHL